MTIINFGAVAVGNDPIFGVVVYGEDDSGREGWQPWSSGTPEQQEWVREQVRNSPLRKCLLQGMEETLFGKGG